MTDVLIVGDTERCSELRHELPLRIGDPFIYAEIGDRRIAVVWSIEGDRIAVVDPTVEIVPVETISIDDLIAAGVDYYEVTPTQVVRAVQSLGIAKARVPHAFPLRLADELRAAGIELVPDQRFFDLRRRRKTPAELEGVRRASRAAEAAMAATASHLARSEHGDGGTVVDGGPLTSELLRGAAEARSRSMARAATMRLSRTGRRPPTAITSARDGSRTTTCSSAISFQWTSRARLLGHDADVLGGRARSRARRLARAHAGGARARARAVLPGADGAELYRTVCRFSRSAVPHAALGRGGTVLREGFNHALGHGVGLEVTRRPLSRGAVRCSPRAT